MTVDEFLAKHCVGMDDHGPGIGAPECEKCKEMKEELEAIIADERSEAAGDALESHTTCGPD